MHDDPHRRRTALRSLVRALAAAPIDTPAACERVRRQVVQFVAAAPQDLQVPAGNRLLMTEVWGDEVARAQEAVRALGTRWSRPGAIEAAADGFAAARELLAASLERLLDRLDAGLDGYSGDRPLAAPEPTGIEEIDLDHAEMFRIIGGLRAAVGGGHAQCDQRSVRELVGLMEQHIEREEAMMEATSYPGFDDHRAEHHRARTIMLGFRNDLDEGRTLQAGLVLAFLETWLATHVAHTDRRMAEFVAKA